MSAERHRPGARAGPQQSPGNPSGCRCSGSAALPLPELNHAAVTKLPDWRTVIWARNAGDETRGQTKLAHKRERGPPCRQSPAPPFNELEIPTAGARLQEKAGLPSHKWGEQENEVILRCPWEFGMTKKSKAGEIYSSTVFSGSGLGPRWSPDHFDNILDFATTSLMIF